MPSASSLADVVLAATGKTVLPIDPANPADAAIIAKIGNVMDRVVPGMNKPESPAHVVSRMDEVTAFFEDALRAFLGTVPSFSCPAPSDEALPPRRIPPVGSRPCACSTSPAGNPVTWASPCIATGSRDAAVRALHLIPADAAARVTEDGICLLVAIETNGKTGKDIAFLNWELLDLS